MKYKYTKNKLVRATPFCRGFVVMRHPKYKPQLKLVALCFLATLFTGAIIFQHLISVAKAADIGTAELVAASAMQVGTGQPGEDSTHVLTNNVVTYIAVYSFTASGSITVTATLDQMSTWDSSTIKECQSGSSINSNSNIATCVILGDAGDVKVWNLSATALGANGSIIKPIFTDSTGTSSIQPSAVTIVATNTNYILNVQGNYPNIGPATDGDTGVDIGAVYTIQSQISDVIGLEPLSSPISFTIDTSSIPGNSWVVKNCTAGSNGYVGSLPYGSGKGSSNYHRVGSAICTRASDGQSISVTITDAYTGGKEYPSVASAGLELRTAFYTSVFLRINIPIDSLTPTPVNVVFTSTPLLSTSLSGATVQTSMNAPHVRSVSSNVFYTNNDLHIETPSYVNLPGWVTPYTNISPVLPGAEMRITLATQPSGPTGFSFANPWGCMVLGIDNHLEILDAHIRHSTFDGLPTTIEYGVAAVLSAYDCGIAGDDGAGWYPTLAQAQASGEANAVRFKIDGSFQSSQFSSGGNQAWLSVIVKVPPNDLTSTTLPEFKAINTGYRVGGDNITTTTVSFTNRMITTDTIASNAISVLKPTVSIGEVQTITVTPQITGATSAISKNVREDVTLPKGLVYVGGSAQFGGVSISDPTIIDNGNDTSTLTFSLGNLPAGQTSGLTFDINISAAAETPSTAQVSSVINSLSNAAQGQEKPRTAATSFTITNPTAFIVPQIQSLATVQPNSEQTYTFSHINTTSDTINNITAIDVLPYNGDVNGTTGLASGPTPYTVSGLSVYGAATANLYYTTDLSIRSDPLNTVTWVSCSSSCTLPAGITAIKWTMASLSPGAITQVSIKLSNLSADNGAAINNALTYLDYTDSSSPLLNSTVVSAVFKKATISGTVYYDVNLSGTFDAGDTGIAGRTVNLTKSGTTIATTTTDSDGVYSFDTLPSGTYSVITSAPANMVTNSHVANDLNLIAGTDMSNQDIGFEAITISISSNNNNLDLGTAILNSDNTGSILLTTTTNSPNGYNMSLGSADNRLVCTAPSYAINSVTGTDISLTNNTWGFKISDTTPTTYNAIPTLSTTIKTFESAARLGDLTKVYFGVRVGIVPVCTYIGQTTFTVVPRE
ncbi:MAG: hypothetical protein LBH36_01300 [Candidatus Nomurabacteria bacterium]|nr:hypothetical protein [Candidatus Nomurabacteria bacterium]